MVTADHRPGESAPEDRHADADFGTNRDEIEVFGQAAAAQARQLVAAVVADLGTQQAGADTQFGFARLHNLTSLDLVHGVIHVQLVSIIGVQLYKSNTLYRFGIGFLCRQAASVEGRRQVSREGQRQPCSQYSLSCNWRQSSCWLRWVSTA